MPKLSLVRLSALMLLAFATYARADDASDSGVQRDLGPDHFAAGNTATITAPVTGDALVAGREVDVLADVGGDLVAAGRDVRVEKPVKQGAYLAGGRVSLNASVARNLRAAGGTVELSSGAHVAGNASLAGHDVLVLGPIDGYLQAAGDRILINTTVAGDAEIAAGHIELGPNARINGKLRYSSRDELKRDAAAQVSGGIEHDEHNNIVWWHGRHGHFTRRAGWAWSVGIVVLAAVLMAVLPAAGRRLGDTVQHRWGWSLLIGLIALICIPIVAVMLLLTIVGIPLALALVAAYILLLIVGYASSGVAVGDLALRRLAPQHSGQTGWRMLAAALAMAVVVLLARIPGLGGLIAGLAILTGIGALLLQLRRPPAPPTQPA